MPGVRLRHATQRNAVLTIVDPTRRYQAPYICLMCSPEGAVIKTSHRFKTYHIKVDDVGAAIVSPEIAAKLGELQNFAGFTILEEVAKPPAQHLDMSAFSLPDVPIIAHLMEPGRG